VQAIICLCELVIRKNDSFNKRRWNSLKLLHLKNFYNAYVAVTEPEPN